MSCDWFEERLQDILDQRLDPADDSQVRFHAQRCPACRTLLDVQRRLFLVFPYDVRSDQEKPQVTASADGGSQVERPGWDRTAWRKWTAVASSSAVVAALAAIVVVGPSVQSPLVSSPAVVSRAPGFVEVAAVEVAAVASTVADGARGAPVAEERARVELAVGEPQFRGERPLAQLVVQLGESISTLPGPHLDGVQELAEGIRPLTDSVGSMVEALRQRWQGPRTERMQAVPDTSWKVEWTWIV